MDTTEYKIEKGIPVPQKTNYSRLRATMVSLEVGDSFSYHAKQTSTFFMQRASFRKSGKDFTSRKIGEDEYRIWRTK